MSIMHEFEFETDSLEDFASMLETSVNILFKYPNSEYTKLHINKEQKLFWEDGSEYKWTDKAILKAGEKIYSIEPCAYYAGARQYKTLNQYVNLKEAAKEASHCEHLPPTRLWVATLSNSSSGFKKGKDDYCQSNAQMIKKATSAMKLAAKRKKEFDKLRTPEWMEEGDGSVGMGFRIALAWDFGSRILDLSLCHVYYGK